MKRCPSCEAPYADEDVFCELDGSRLSAGDAGVPLDCDAPTTARSGACPSCGARGSDDGEGYCGTCGHRLDARATASVLPPGAAIGAYTVKSARAPDDVLAVAPDGANAAVAIGDAGLLADEAAAIRGLGGLRAMPTLVELGEDPGRGSFLVLSPLVGEAKPLAEVAPKLDVLGALAFAREVLSVVEAFERAGFRWTPRATDFYVASGELCLSRARVAPLEIGPADACCPLAVAGRPFVPVPAVSGTAALFRVLAGTGLDVQHVKRDVGAMRAELGGIEEELSRPRTGPSDVAVECDPGLRRRHNEDAVAHAVGETSGQRWTVLVVCDGVSCSTHAEQASALAAKTACDVLAHFARSGDIGHEAASSAMAAAIRAAHLAICSAQIDYGTSEPPGTTIVASLVYRQRLTVGWVGDSRAYWIGKNGSELLTRDHSWAQEAVVRGEMTEAEAMRQPLAHALTRCLGPLEADEDDGETSSVEPDVRGRDLPGPGYVILCSDGLWNYYPDARTIAELVHGAGVDATCRTIARRLVNHALSCGGGDNVSVAIYGHSRIE